MAETARCPHHSHEAADPNCPMCVEFYGIAPAPRTQREVVEEHRRATPAHMRPTMPEWRMTTLQELPNHRIVRIAGLVSHVASNSGWTASSKGNNALDAAFAEIGSQAKEIGGDAVVGVTIAAFGARGGVTSVMGGDAVGIAIIGTAVVTEQR